jgi:predicted Zn-dependent protease
MHSIGRMIGTALLGLALLAPPLAAPAQAQGVREGGSTAKTRALPDEVQQAVQQFGGLYQAPELERYIASLGNLLVQTTKLAGQPFTFGVLDSPIVNAFSLPGGYVFVTRGLLALANSEAEAAGVIGHEIGHITANHAAHRQTRSVIAQLGAGVIGALLGSQAIGQALGAGAALYVQKYSRDQEFEADELGVTYMSRAGFDPRAMGWFLESMEMESRLENLLAGRGANEEGVSWLADHPSTPERVQRAIAEARDITVRDPMVARDVYLKKIDGILYGEDPAQGVVRDRVFLHPALRFRFEVPQGFHIINGDRQVLAQGPNGAAIVFDRNPKPFRGSALEYLTQGWAPNAQLTDVQRFDVNGLDAATARAKARTQDGTTVDARLVAIHDGDVYYRFLLVAPPGAGDFEDAFRRTVLSFRHLSAREAAEIRPYRVRVVEVRPGDSIDGFVRRMATPDHARERFLVLNALKGGEQLRPGDKVKIVAE